jgi:hypothetical protein
MTIENVIMMMASMTMIVAMLLMMRTTSTNMSNGMNKPTITSMRRMRKYTNIIDTMRETRKMQTRYNH